MEKRAPSPTRRFQTTAAGTSPISSGNASTKRRMRTNGKTGTGRVAACRWTNKTLRVVGPATQLRARSTLLDAMPTIDWNTPQTAFEEIWSGNAGGRKVKDQSRTPGSLGAHLYGMQAKRRHQQ